MTYSSGHHIYLTPRLVDRTLKTNRIIWCSVTGRIQGHEPPVDAHWQQATVRTALIYSVGFDLFPWILNESRVEFRCLTRQSPTVSVGVSNVVKTTTLDPWPLTPRGSDGQLQLGHVPLVHVVMSHQLIAPSKLLLTVRPPAEERFLTWERKTETETGTEGWVGGENKRGENKGGRTGGGQVQWWQEGSRSE